MANILTNLRELSVGVSFFTNKDSKELTPEEFNKICSEYIQNYSKMSTKISVLQDKFSTEEQQTIQNSLELGRLLKDKLNITQKSPNITWCGNDKEDLIDLKIGNELISLKEDSFILRNIGLYQLLNFITNSNQFKRGLHIFKQFAPQEFENWFQKAIISLSKSPNFKYKSDKGYISTGEFKKDTLILRLDSTIITLNNVFDISYDMFEKLTSSKIREKVFSKWLKTLPESSEYYQAKVECANKAGNNLLDFVKSHLVESSEALLHFFNLENFSYIYAKNDGKETKIFRVPAKKSIDFHNYKIIDVSTSIPDSQLNFKTTIQNIETKSFCTLRNEIRYSHGQLNGTPEAKLYYDSGDGLEELIYHKL